MSRRQPLDTFESRLLNELRDVVDRRASTAPQPGVPHTPTVARRHWLAAAATAAAVGTIAIWATGSAGNPAYAVEENEAGDVTFSLFDPDSAPELEDALADHGITADVTVLPMYTECAEGRFPEERDHPDWLPNPSIGGRDSDTTQTIPSGFLEDGQTLVIVYSGTRDDAQPGETAGTRIAVANGPVGECVPVDYSDEIRPPVDGP